MAEDTNVGTSQEEQPTTPAQEETEQIAPNKDNAIIENKESDEDLRARLAELEAKVARQSTLLRASKDEALKLKNERDALKAQPVQTQSDDPQVTPADVAAFKALARAAGIPLNEELQQQIYSKESESAKERFIKEFPEYGQVGDEKSDAAWDKLMAEAGQYKVPEDPSKWYDILKKAHKDISSTPELQLEKGKSLGMAQANLNASLGGGSSGASASAPKKKQTPEQKAVADEFDKILQNRSYYKK
jgi:hypothetical protein